MITKGDQTPVIPFGEVVFKVGAGFPEQNAKVGEKLGVVLGFTLIVTVSLMGFPQEFVAVRVNTIEPDAVKGNV